MRELCHLGSVSIVFMNFPDEAEESTDLSSVYLGDSSARVLASSLMILLKHCFVADLLCSRVQISPLLISSNFGSSRTSDVSPLAALFAWESAASFPSIPSWPRDHLMTSFLLSCSSISERRSSRKAL